MKEKLKEYVIKNKEKLLVNLGISLFATIVYGVYNIIRNNQFNLLGVLIFFLIIFAACFFFAKQSKMLYNFFIRVVKLLFRTKRKKEATKNNKNNDNIKIAKKK